MNTKPTNPNPKDAAAIKKLAMHVVPQQALAEVGLALMEGGRKYGEFNYRVAGVRASVYFDAVWRHLAAWWEGQDIDPDSGVHHVSKAIAGLIVLRDSMLMGNHTDDRPVRVVDQEWMNEANKKAGVIVDKYPNPVPPNTQASVDAARAEPLIEIVRDTQRRINEFREAYRFYDGAKGPSVVMDKTPSGNVVVKEYDQDGLCVRETVHPESKEAAIRECEARWGVVFEGDGNN